MNSKHYLATGATAISLVAVSRFMGGYAASETQAKKHVAIIVAEIGRILGHSIGKSEEGRLVKPDGVWLTVRLSAHGYGSDAYSDLDETMKLNGWSMLPDRRQAYCKNGTVATLRSAENIGERSSVVVVDLKFSSFSLSRCEKPKDGNKLR